jgi:hypothetical protein
MQPTPTPVIGMLTATPNLLSVNVQTTVTVSASITGGTPVANGVNLVRLGATGTQSTILGVMHDDGLNGDGSAGDGVYSLRVVFNETLPVQFQVQVSAAFRGLLKRIQSGPFNLDVWQTKTDQDFGVALIYPPNANLAKTTGSLHIETNSNGNSDQEQFSDSEFFLDLSSRPVTDDPNWLTHVSNPESLTLSGGIVGVRGERSDESISPLPGYDMYVVIGPTLYTIAGTYDGLSTSSLATIKLIQQSLIFSH